MTMSKTAPTRNPGVGLGSGFPGVASVGFGHFDVRAVFFFRNPASLDLGFRILDLGLLP